MICAFAHSASAKCRDQSLILSVSAEFEIGNAAHFLSLEHPRVLDERVHPVDRVAAPEQLVAHDEGGHAEDASTGRRFGVGYEALLDTRVAAGGIGVNRAQCIAQASPLMLGVTALAVDEVERCQTCERLAPSATKRRCVGSELKGWRGGMRNGMPSFEAAHVQ